MNLVFFNLQPLQVLSLFYRLSHSVLLLGLKIASLPHQLKEFVFFLSLLGLLALGELAVEPSYPAVAVGASSTPRVYLSGVNNVNKHRVWLLVDPSASFRVWGGDPGWERKEKRANCRALRGFHSSLSFMEDG